MAKNRIYGISEENEIKPDELYRNTKKKSQQFIEFLATPEGGSTALLSCAAVAFIIPGLSDTSLLIGSLVAWFNLARKQTLPFRLPKYTNRKDYNDLDPNGKASPAGGIFHLGVDKDSGQELWLTKSDVCTHQLIFGTTGAGKTESLLSMVFNALVQGSGFVYVDGKGDTSLWKKAFSLARMMGRDDDLLLINYMTGDKDVRAGSLRPKLSHNSNPFANGSSSSLSNLLTSLMDGGGDGKGADMWKGRAISLASALMQALSYLRDEGEILLDVHTIREYMHINKIIDLSKRTDLPADAKNAIKGYLESLPAYNDRKGYNQAEATTEQHGYLYMQFTKILGSLSETYGHIFKTQMGEVDMYDVVVNRRILITMLPALEKPDEELTNLGKIIVSMLKSMMASCLGSEVVGLSSKIYDSKETNAETPFPCILDEYGYYAVKGTAVMFAQARSLNIQMIAAGQDYPAFKKGSPEEAASIVANCITKMCGKLEDPTETLDIIQKSGGETYTTHTGGFARSHGAILSNYSDEDRSSIEKRHRINFFDLKGQGLGEMHVVMGTKIVRARMFYANPKSPYATGLNSFLKIAPPPRESLERMAESLNSLTIKIQDNNFHNSMPSPVTSPDINMLIIALTERKKLTYEKAAMTALVDYRTAIESNEIHDLLSDDSDESKGGEGDRLRPESMDVFGEKHPNDFPDGTEEDLNDMEASFNNENKTLNTAQKMHSELFRNNPSAIELAESIGRQAHKESINKIELEKNIIESELETGVNNSDSIKTAQNIVNQMEQVSSYPKESLEIIEEDEFSLGIKSALEQLSVAIVDEEQHERID